MKRAIVFATAIMVSLTCCERNGSDPGSDKDAIPDAIDKNVLINIGKDLSYKFSDIELYDSSTHILYFSDNHPELDKYSSSTFAFITDGDTVYTGDFWPSIRSDLPTRPYISTWPFFFQDYAIRIENREQNKPDPRNDDRIIDKLEEQNLLHSGLRAEINSSVRQDPVFILTLSITNMDESALLILDPDKMGNKLFHYFTNGLFVRKVTEEQFTFSIKDYEAPSPLNTWSPDWLTVLQPGEVRQFTFNYEFSSPLSAGEYNFYIKYPGLSSQISKEDLIQGSGRIWLGDVTAVKKVTIE